MIWGDPRAGGKSNICFCFYIFFLKSEFGFLPKNSDLNLWRFQFWGTLAWVPSPSRHPPPPKKKTTDGSASRPHQRSKRSSTHGWSINVGAQGRAPPTFVLILSMQCPCNAHAMPHSFHAMQCPSLLRLRVQEGARCPGAPPFRRLWCRIADTNSPIVSQ